MKCLTWLKENQGVRKKREVDDSNSSEETICRTDFQLQINRLTAKRYTVIFISHEETIDMTDEVTGEVYKFIQPKGTSNEKSSMRMLRDLCDYCIYCRPNGIDKETYETINSTAICKEQRMFSHVQDLQLRQSLIHLQRRI